MFSRAALGILLNSLIIVYASADAATIVTIVGIEWAFPRDHRPAPDLPLGSVQGVAIDSEGNLLIADPDNHIVLKVKQAHGSTSVLAGNGKPVSTGDGGPAADAGLSKPHDVAVDRTGVLYIAQPDRIRKITTDGLIQTIAGGGRLAAANVEGGRATDAHFGLIGGIAVDSSGNVYFAEYWTSQVRRVGPDGVLTTVAGTGRRGFSGDGGSATEAELGAPTGVAVDSSGNLYIADNLNGRIRIVNKEGIIDTFAGGGKDVSDGIPAKHGVLSQPQRLAVDQSGNLYIGGYFTCVRKVSPDGIISTIAGTQQSGKLGFGGDGGPARDASVAWPRGVAIDASGNVYFADSGNGRIRKVSTDGKISTAAGNGRYRFITDGSAASDATLTNPGGVSIDAAGNVYIADTGQSQVLKMTPDGKIAHYAGTKNRGGDSSRALTASLSNPEHLAFDRWGNLYIADHSLSNVMEVLPDGAIKKVAGTNGWAFRGDGEFAIFASLQGPSGVAADAAGNLYIADSENHRIRKVTGGRITTVAGDGESRFLGEGEPASKAFLTSPSDVVVDSSGIVFIADTGNCRIRKLAPDGTISTVAGDGRCRFRGDSGPAAAASLNRPHGLALDAAGNLYIADTMNNRIRKVTRGGIISTIAGNGQAGLAGDGGDSMDASLRRPRGVAVDATGNIYIADSGNDRIRLVRSGSVPVSSHPARLPDGGTLISRAQEAESKFHTLQYTAETTQELEPGTRPQTTTQTVYLANPGKVRMEAKDNELLILMVSDGRSLWIYNAAAKRYTKMSSDLGPSAWLTALGINIPKNVHESAKTVREETIEIDRKKHDCWVVESQNSDMSSVIPENLRKTGVEVMDMTVTWWFDKEISIELQSAVSSKIKSPGKSTLQSYSRTVRKNIKIDESIDDSLFVFSPAPDAKEVGLADLFRKAAAASSNSDLIGKKAPAFELKGLDSKIYSVAALQGKPVLLDFWATWCAPCVENMPVLDKIYRDYRDIGLVVLGVNAGEDRDVVEAFLKEQPMPYPVMLSGDSGVLESYNVHTYPTYVLIGPDGKVAAYKEGFTDVDEFMPLLFKVRVPRKFAPPPPILLAPPVRVAPADDTLFNMYPRTIVYSWNPVAGASRYGLEIEYCQSGRVNCLPWLNTTTTANSATNNFVGAQPGRWRVWSINNAIGATSVKTDWWWFESRQ